MKLFVSWSKDTSHAVAIAIRDWLPFVVPSTEPWVSSEDISKGSRGRDAIVKELAGTGQGIICLTRQNVREPWLNFEAGALSNYQTDARVRTVLFDLKPSDVVGPLSDFQHTDLNDEEDVLKLIRSVNEASEQQLTDRQLAAYFERFWPDFVTELGKIRESQSQLPIGDDGAVPRSSDQVLEEVLDRVRLLDRRQTGVMRRIANVDRQIAILGDSMGLQFDPRRGDYVAFPNVGVGRVVARSDKYVNVEFEKGRNARVDRRALEHAHFRPTFALAQEDYEQMQRAMDRSAVANPADGGRDTPIGFDLVETPNVEWVPLSDDEETDGS